jgi:hypothetical protein
MNEGRVIARARREVDARRMTVVNPPWNGQLRLISCFLLGSVLPIIVE